jgi:hypothetical protein
MPELFGSSVFCPTCGAQAIEEMFAPGRRADERRKREQAVIEAARAEFLHRFDPDSHWLDELHDAVAELEEL